MSRSNRSRTPRDVSGMRYLAGLALLLLVAGCGTEAPTPTPAPAIAAATTKPTATTPEVQYLALVEGVPGVDTSTGDPALVQAGYKACSFSAEYPRNNVIARTMLNEAVDKTTATVIVHAATTYLCPALKE